MARRLPDYGLDAPNVVRGFLLWGGLVALLGALLLAGVLPLAPALRRSAGSMLVWPGAIFFLEGLWMTWASAVGKRHARDRLLDGVALRGDERVLDVGCGRGLLLIGAAKRLTSGRAVGLDLWSQSDLGANSKQAALANARAEGVEGDVEVHDGDMRKMPFRDGEFDVVLASLSIHNIPDREGRRQAIREIARVLKPGGHVALQDFRATHEYALDLVAYGCEEVKESGPVFWIFPPVTVVTGKKRG